MICCILPSTSLIDAVAMLCGIQGAGGIEALCEESEGVRMRVLRDTLEHPRIPK